MKSGFLIVVLFVASAQAEELKHCDLKGYTEPGSLGLVTDTAYINCRWPFFDHPVALFAKGSSGISVQGPPTPRNVVFPPDTKALNRTRLDVFYLRKGDFVSELNEKEVQAIINGDKTPDDIAAETAFIPITQTKDDPAGMYYKIDKGTLKTITKKEADTLEATKPLIIEEVVKP